MAFYHYVFILLIQLAALLAVPKLSGFIRGFIYKNILYKYGIYMFIYVFALDSPTIVWVGMEGVIDDCL